MIVVKINFNQSWDHNTFVNFLRGLESSLIICEILPFGLFLSYVFRPPGDNIPSMTTDHFLYQQFESYMSDLFYFEIYANFEKETNIQTESEIFGVVKMYSDASKTHLLEKMLLIREIDGTTWNITSIAKDLLIDTVHLSEDDKILFSDTSEPSLEKIREFLSTYQGSL